MRASDEWAGRIGLRCLLLGVVVAACGCARTTVVGVSDEGADAAMSEDGGERGFDGQAAPAAGAEPKRSSVIRVRPNELLLGSRHPVLGDVDGDGFDDFLVTTEMDPPLPEDGGSISAYLFYGRPKFPELLSLDDADASFRATHGVGAVGDVNGDGFDDWALHHAQSIEFVWGGPNRHAGAQPVHASGTVWSSPMLPPPFAEGLTTLQYVLGAGDVNCDGFDDVVVLAGRWLEEEESTVSSAFGMVMTPYLVLGRDSLPEGVWDPSWAIARFEPVERVPDEWWETTVIPARDLDGDGCDDLLSMAGDRWYVYYGGKEHPRGRVEPDSARAALALDEGTDILALPDLDGDGASELLLSDYGQTRWLLTYGTRERLSGEVVLTPALEIWLEQPAFGSFSIDVGDINGDTWPELVVSVGASGSTESIGGAPPISTGTLFAVLGSGERLRGQIHVNDGEVLVSGAELAPLPWESDEVTVHRQTHVPSISLAGDVDGDGGRDIIAHVLVPTSLSGEVRLIPSTPRRPD